MSLYFILPEQIEEIWQDVVELIQQTDDNVTKAEDIYEFLSTERWQLWVYVHRGEIQVVGTTSFVYYVDKKMCRIETVAGTDRTLWMHCLRNIEEWAQQNGCVAMDIFGRRGWEKVLKSFEYNFEAILLRKYF